MSRNLRLISKMVAALALAIIFAGTAQGQSLNLDFSSGAGVPSSTFGALGKAGLWNLYDAQVGAFSLAGLDGLPSGVTVEITGADGGSQDVNLAAANLNLEALISDRYVSTFMPIVTTFQGLANGTYTVFTYVGSGSRRTKTVEINGDPSTSVELTTGWTGVLVEGMTHSIHFVNVTDGSLSIAVVQGDPFVSGVQLVIPAPGTTGVLALIACAGASQRKRRRDFGS